MCGQNSDTSPAEEELSKSGYPNRTTHVHNANWTAPSHKGEILTHSGMGQVNRNHRH